MRSDVHELRGVDALVVFDASFAPDHLPSVKGRRLACLPLTADAQVVRGVVERAEREGVAARILPAAHLLEEAAVALRDPYIRFVAELPSRGAAGADLTKLFALDDTASAWWFSLVAEKNTVKSDAFNRLAQFEAVCAALESEGARELWVACDAPRLCEALRVHCRSTGVAYKGVAVTRRGGWREKLERGAALPLLRHATLLAVRVGGLARRTHRIAAALRHEENPVLRPGGLLAVSYYPNMNGEAARGGEYANGYLVSLQEELDKRDVPIRWLSLYVKNTTYSFEKAMSLIATFRRGGRRFELLEEYITPSVQLRALVAVLGLSVHFVLARRRIRALYVLRGRDVWPLFADEWHSSFAGATGFLGAAYYYAFQAALAAGNETRCLYACEMQAWEKALIGARDRLGLDLPIYGYQHATVSRMLLNYFNDPSETAGQATYPMPMAERVIVDGQQPRRSMMESDWPAERIAIAEAVRYAGVVECLANRRPKDPNVVFLPLSMGVGEAAALLQATAEAIRGLDVEVWVRSHPFLPVEDALAAAHVPPEAGFQVRTEPLYHLLERATTVVVGESSAAVEALAAGCRVVIVKTAEWIDMSPLRDIVAEAVIHVDSVEALRAAIERGGEPLSPGARDEAEAVVRDILELPGPRGPVRFLDAIGYGG